MEKRNGGNRMLPICTRTTQIQYIKKQQNYTKRGIKIRFHIWIRCLVNVLLAGNTNERNLQIALRATVKVLIKH